MNSTRYDLNSINLDECMKLNEELRISPIISNGEVIGFEKSSGVDMKNLHQICSKIAEKL